MDTQRIKRLRRILTLHFSVIACLTAILVANNGSGSIFLPALICLVAATAFITVDLLELFHLGQIGSYIGMAVATVLALTMLAMAAVNGNESSQLLSVAGLLIYPQCVLLFQKKSLRVFEQLAVFLLLQMIVAALINDNILYGILLTPILLAWVSSLFLFARYATIVSLSPDVEEPVPLLYELLYTKYLRPSIRSKNSPTSVAVAAVVDPSTLTTKGKQRWLLSAPLGITALLFGGSLFYFLPRNNQASSLASLALDKTGIPDRINPGFFGRVLSDPTPVLRLKLTMAGRAFKPSSPPYVRVDVFDRYFQPSRQRANGNWLRSTIFERRAYPVDSSVRNRDRVKVEVKGKNTPGGKSSKILISVPPLLNKLDDFAYDRSLMIFDQITEEHPLSHKKHLSYSYYTGAFSNGWQVAITPDLSLATPDILMSLGVSLPNADKKRQKILDDSGVDRSNAYAVAKALEEHFRDSGEYKYSLDVPPLHEPTIDPIEDFIVNTKTGLCQHYASALVSMLRQSGIPSRIVIGYRPIEWNKLGEFFQVRLSDSHAWVEAQIDRNDLVGTEHAVWLSEHQKYWLLLDPTPADRSDLSIQEQNKPLEYAEDLWDNYLSSPQGGDMQSTYAPMAQASQDQALRWLSSIGGFGRAIFGEWFSNLGFAWQLTLSIIVLGSLAIFIWQFILWLPRLAPNLAFRLGIRRPSSAIQQAFYARCVALLESLRLKRPDSETLQEFSDRACQAIESRTEPSTSPRLALSVLGELYHRLRFSSDKVQSQLDQNAIEQHLQAVEQAVRAARKRP